MYQGAALVLALSNRNPSVSVMEVHSAAWDTEDVARSTANRKPNANVCLHVGKAPWGEPLLSTNKPTTKNPGKDLYTLPDPHKHTHCYHKPDVPSTTRNYSLFPDSPYCWQPDKLGLTTPCLMQVPRNFNPVLVTSPPPSLPRRMPPSIMTPSP